MIYIIYDKTTKKKQPIFTPFPAVNLMCVFQHDPGMLQYHIGNDSEIRTS